MMSPPSWNRRRSCSNSSYDGEETDVVAIPAAELDLAANAGAWGESSMAMDTEESPVTGSQHPHPSIVDEGRDNCNSETGASDLDRRESWKEALRRSCLERARNAKRRLVTGGSETIEEEAPPTSVSPDLASPMNDSTFFGSNTDSHSAATASSSASKRRRVAYDTNDGPSRRHLLAQKAIHEALMEQGSSGSFCLPTGGSVERYDGRTPQQPLRTNGTEDRHQQHQRQQLSPPINSYRSTDDFVMTNEEWLDLLRQVQDELDADWGELDETGFRGDEESEFLREGEEERLLDEARAEQAYWDGLAEDWMEGQGESGRSDDPGRESARTTLAGRVPTTALRMGEEEEEGHVTSDLVCPVCQEARLSFVTNECDAADADDDALNNTNGCVSGSIVCPNHMDGSCSMRIDHVPVRADNTGLGPDGDPTTWVGRHAMETLRQRLGNLSYEHGGSTCTHPLAFEVTDQVLHATCVYCGGSKSVRLASWFPSYGS